MALGAQFTMGHFQGLDNAGVIVPYGKLYFTDAFTGGPITTYKNSGLTVVNTHPIILSASGKAEIFLTSNTYNVVLTDADDVVVWSHEGYIPVGLGVDPTAWREKIVATAAQTDFVYANPVDSATLVFVNGVLKEFGASEDYIIVPPYTVKFNTGRTVADEVVAFGAAPSTSVSVLYADGSVPMNEGYVPALPQDIATRDFVVSSDIATRDFVVSSPAFTGVPTAPTATAGTNTNQIATAAFALSNDIGVNQTWQNLSGSRADGEYYTNNTGKPIQITLYASANVAVSASINVDGHVVAYSNVPADIANARYAFVTAIVPNNSTYRYSVTYVGGSLYKRLVHELR